MSARRSPEGNGDNALSYTCNVRARARAHARAMGVKPAVASVATVANSDEWLTNPQFETVAQTVASARTVAITGNPLDIAESFPLAHSTQGTARAPP
jgi:hypothetical protein